jgi:hypothetical protein
MSEGLIYVMSKNQKYLSFVVWGIPNNLSNFYVSYIWYIMFFFTLALMFFYNKYKFTPKTIPHIVYGVLICTIGLTMHNFIANYNWLYKSNNNKFFKRNIKNSQLSPSDVDGDKYVVVLNPDNLKLKNLEELTYIFTSSQFKKIKHKYKLKTLPYDDYFAKNTDNKWNNQQLKWGSNKDFRIFWHSFSKNTHYVTTILLSFAFVLATWKIKIFYKIFPWIIVSLIPQILSTFWIKYGNFKERNIYMFVIERLQMLSCYFSIYTLILFMSFSQK